jgi:hypothetical protein
LAVDLASLIEEARRHDGDRAGAADRDFIAPDEPLFRLYAGAAAIDDHRLRAAAGFSAKSGPWSRTVFALRILVDIA